MNRIIILFGLFIIILIGCREHEYSVNMPDDFSFVIIKDTESYNSKTGKFERSYIEKDSSINVILTQTELETIYQSYRKSDFLSFPKVFVCSDSKIFDFNTYTLPAYETTIEIKYKDVNIEVTNTSYCKRKKENRKSKRFEKFSSIISEIINKKEQVIKMKGSNIMAL